MSTPAYRYVLCDLLTDRLLAVLPLTGVSFDRRISRTGSLSATLSASTPEHVRLARLLYDNAGKAALWVYRDNALWWGGIPWTVAAKQGERGAVEVSVQAATFDSYAHHRLLPTDVGYVGVDQGVIVPDLWRKIQADPRGNIGVIAVDQPTGRLRDRTYLVSEGNYVGKIIEDLGDVIDGPEHTIDTYVDGSGARVKSLRVGAALGTTSARAMFSRARGGGGGVTEWGSTRDAVDGGTRFQARGDAASANVGTESEPLLSAPVEVTALLDAGWPLLDVLEDHSTTSRATTLDGHAEAMASTRAGAMPTSGYTVTVGESGWSPNRLGDPVRIKLHDLWHEGTDETVRPVGCQVTPAERGNPESVTLLLGEDD